MLQTDHFKHPGNKGRRQTEAGDDHYKWHQDGPLLLYINNKASSFLRKDLQR